MFAVKLEHFDLANLPVVNKHGYEDGLRYDYKNPYDSRDYVEMIPWAEYKKGFADGKKEYFRRNPDAKEKFFLDDIDRLAMVKKYIKSVYLDDPKSDTGHAINRLLKEIEDITVLPYILRDYVPR